MVQLFLYFKIWTVGILENSKKKGGNQERKGKAVGWDQMLCVVQSFIA